MVVLLIVLSLMVFLFMVWDLLILMFFLMNLLMYCEVKCVSWVFGMFSRRIGLECCRILMFVIMLCVFMFIRVMMGLFE